MTRAPLLPGKLPAHHLERLLASLHVDDPRVVVPARIGEDAAVIDMGGHYLVAASDPITFAADRVGWYAVHVNANDVAVMGARPRWFLVVLLLPDRADAALPEAIMADIGEACAGLGVTICGGHTEVTPGLERPIVVGHMLGEVAKARLVTKTAIQSGDRIVLTRGVAIEGTAILARERHEQLAACMDAAHLRAAQELLFRPGISVVGAALCAAGLEGVRAMHDPTEGGLVNALFELAAPSGLGVRVEETRIPIFEETRRVCAALGLDPLCLLASGALLIVVTPEAAESLLSRLQAEGIDAAAIGEVRPSGDGICLRRNGLDVALERPVQDEIARV